MSVPPSVSVNILTRDNEDTIGRALSTVVGWCSEVVVIDTGSKDGTIKIVQEEVPRDKLTLLHSKWRNDSAFHRNVALKASKGDWVLVLDSDEWLESPSGDDVLKMLASVPADVGAILVQVASILEDGTLSVDWCLRLFRREGAAWEHPRHPQVVLPDGVKGTRAEIRLGHTGYIDGARVKRKLEDTLEVLLQQDPDSDHTLYWSAVTLAKLERYSEALSMLNKLVSRDLSKRRRSEALGLAAFCALRLGNYELANRLCDLGAALDPENPDFHFVRGVVCLGIYINLMHGPTGDEQTVTRTVWTGHLLDKVARLFSK
jgi:glycosyltransferase involved in cell wall biosynthesis